MEFKISKETLFMTLYLLAILPFGLSQMIFFFFTNFINIKLLYFINYRN